MSLRLLERSPEEYGRVLWIIDGQYVYNIVDEGTGGHVDLLLLREFIEKQIPVWKAYYFTGIPQPMREDQQRFLDWVRHRPPGGPGFIVKPYRLKPREEQCPHCQRRYTVYREKGVDVGMAVLMLRLASLYDTLLLTSGDADLADALQFLVETQGKHVILASFEGTVAPLLSSFADEVIWLDPYVPQLVRETDERASARTA